MIRPSNDFQTTQNSLAFKNNHFTLQVAIEIYFLLATFLFYEKMRFYYTTFCYKVIRKLGGVIMTLKIMKTLLSIIMVIMYYLGFWTETFTIKIVIFFLMLIFIFEAGMETGKKQNNSI